MASGQNSAQRDTAEPIMNLIGQKIALGPLQRELLPYYQRWMNDADVNALRIYTLRPMTWEAVEVWYEQVSKEMNLDAAFFTIYERSTTRPIGLTMLLDIAFLNKSAEFAISIGEKDCWHKGYGTETTRLMLDYAFRVVGLHSVRLRTLSFNTRAIHVYEHVGFQHAGIWREAHPFEGKLHNIVLMDCLARDFFMFDGQQEKTIS
ncbi:GNAT family N-acetyltransferase [Ktedonobacter racemifer]|uniref:GCN5-related N-acetyltransferase n=1 Tax=Ktedonobacter racemifer DSM 44963 TaxID=485913 RepID=D6TCA2_KTERA|nr:GNAT family N-acetyltransferase [Ktedonobacter racemifer]EFH89919.1 GCN5-related N-acetyltransferase [Ktedonobacter racemifer DSM 44963]